MKIVKLAVRSLQFVPAFTLLASAAWAGPQALSFYPAKAWTSSQAGSGCQISNRYNNGYVLDFNSSASGSSLSLDFKQPAFQPGQSYDVTLGVPGQIGLFVKGTAKAPSVISINLAEYPDFIPALKQASQLDFEMAGNKFSFFMTGYSNASAAFDSCRAGMSGSSMSRNAAVSQPQRQQQVMQNPAPVAAYQAPPAVIGAPSPAKEEPPAIEVTVHNKNAMLPMPDSPKPSMRTTMPEMAAEVEVSAIKPAAPAAMVPKPVYTPEPKKPVSSYMESGDWNLEKATMRYQEADRQLKQLGQKLQQERAQCRVEKKELETMLFDPQLTSENQLAKLASLEEQLAEAKMKLQDRERYFQEQLKVLKAQQGAY